MPTHQVNLDSLILRQPFDSVSDASVLGHDPLFKLEELHRTKMYFRLLRKPDFQRETANWPPAMIVDFVRTFLDNGLIPSIIIWHSKETNNVFIIDGAHRVSALIAWVNDDYGNGEISSKAWGHSVPSAQALLHTKTKQLMDETIGSYAQLYDFGLNPEKTDDLVKRRRGKAIATMQLYIQKVEGDATIAEESFFKINSNSVAIDDTELDMIRGRRKPNAIATRALISAGKGYKYWQHFSNAPAIEATAARVNNLLFGELLEIGPHSPDLPRAGQPYSSEGFRMVLDIVNMFNGVTPAMWTYRPRSRASGPPVLSDDIDGTKTLEYLEAVEKIALLVAGPAECKGSLGLEQAVYAYGSTGKINSAAYLASLRFAAELRDKDKLIAFTVFRNDFEEFLVRNKAFVNALSSIKGSRTRPVESILQMYRIIFESLQNGINSDDDIIRNLRDDPRLTGLPIPVSDDIELPGKRFSRNVVKAKIVEEVLSMRPKCPICGARLPPSCRSKDHARKQAEGGMGNIENLQFAHPFCNCSRDAIIARRNLLGRSPN